VLAHGTTGKIDASATRSPADPRTHIPPSTERTSGSGERHANSVGVVDRRWTDPEVLKRIFPAIRDATPPEIAKFERAVESGFDVVATLGTFELRRRRADVGDAVCDGIAG
jgi:hypothetical protein